VKSFRSAQALLSFSLVAALTVALAGNAVAMQTGSSAPDDALPPLDLSHFNPAAQQLTGVDTPGKTTGAWTSSLTVSCSQAPAYGDLNAPQLNPVFGAPSASGCANQFVPSQYLHLAPNFVGIPFTSGFVNFALPPSYTQFNGIAKVPSFGSFTSVGRIGGSISGSGLKMTAPSSPYVKHAVVQSQPVVAKTAR
jgi:hypothetical protein